MLPHNFRFPKPVRRVAVALGLILASVLAISSGAFSQSLKVFEAVEVRGAEFIPEQDIQMTCGAVPNVPYLELELRAIEECLMSTAVFESVSLVPEGDTLVINVQELNTRPGRVEGSLSYASQDGVIAGVFFERYNLFPDTYGSVRLDYNKDIRRAEGQLYRVDIVGDAVDLGLRFGWEELSIDDGAFFQEASQVEGYLAWSLGEGLQIEGGLGYRDYRLFDVAATSSPLLQMEQTAGIGAPYLRFSLAHNSLKDGDTGWDEPAYSVSLDHFLWNIGTDAVLSDFRLETRSFFPLAPDLRMLINLDAGTVSNLSDGDTRVMDRFAPGADRFRGFAPRGIGPRDKGTALGGQHYVISTIEVQRNLQDLFDRPLVGGAFFQIGGAWGLENTLGGRIDDSFHKRSSVGLSVSFELGEAPVSLFVAFPVDKEDGDEEQVFGLSLTTRF